MRLLDRYLFHQSILPLVFCLAGFVSLTVIIDLFGHFDEIFKHQIPWSSIVEYYLMFSPQVVVVTLPLSILLTMTFVVGNLHRHNEITAMRASGLSFRRILTPLLVVGLLGATTVFIFNEHIIPPATLRLEQLRAIFFDDQTEETARVHTHITMSGAGNRLYHAQSFDPTTNTMHDITILEHDTAQRLSGKIYARRAQWDGQQWIFYEGFTARLDAHGNLREDIERFTERAIPLAERPQDFTNQEIRPELMRFFQLRLYLDQLDHAPPATRQRLAVELAYKLAMPWTCVVMVLLGVPFSLRHRGGMLTGMGLSVLCGTMYYCLFAICVALGKGGTLGPHVAVWTPHVVFATVGIGFLSRIR